MRVFLTGGTGLIGAAVTAELLANGHRVLVLARSAASARAAAAAGAEAVAGSLADLGVLREQAAAADGVIHLAFANDFTSPLALAHAIDEESAALLALGESLVGSGRPLVTVSGTPRAEGRAAVESDPLPTDGPVGGRAITVDRVLALAARDVRTAAVRLPRTVHRDGAGGFAGLLARSARTSGRVGYPGDGAQRWPAVHALDAAVLFRLVLERAAPGSAWHAVADEGDPVRAIAEVIGRRLGVPVGAVPTESFGALGPVFAADQPASSAHTRATLGWEPAHPRLLDDLERLQP